MAFTQNQLDQLTAALDRSKVSQRQQAGQTLSYVEGWYTIDLANRIFGFGHWDRETIELRCVSERTVEKTKRNSTEKYDQYQVSYVATVRIMVRAGEDVIVRQGTGAGHGQSSSSFGDSHESAVKEAETDAMKRALMTFGYPFGLALYDKTQEHVVDEADKQRRQQQGFYDDLVERLAKAHSTDDLVLISHDLAAYTEKLGGTHLEGQAIQAWNDACVRVLSEELAQVHDDAGIRGAFEHFKPLFEDLPQGHKSIAGKWINARYRELGIEPPKRQKAA